MRRLTLAGGNRPNQSKQSPQIMEFGRIDWTGDETIRFASADRSPAEIRSVRLRVLLLVGNSRATSLSHCSAMQASDPNRQRRFGSASPSLQSDLLMTSRRVARRLLARVSSCNAIAAIIALSIKSSISS